MLPTPAVALLTAELGVDIGVVLSASHNPMPDNGIKFLARGGHKLDDELEAAIEARMGEDWERPLGGDVGRIRVDTGRAGEQYVEHLVGTIDVPLTGLRIAVDCANGAASDVGPGGAAGGRRRRRRHQRLARRAQHQREVRLDAPRAAAGRRRRLGADLGVAFDGDADRCLAVDASGVLVDGDQIMGILAIAMRDRGDLVDDTLVTTVMSNLGLKIAMREAGIATIDTAVGDRYVLEAMRAGRYSLGGEQSGHIIMAAHATTGDGVLTALQLAARVAATGDADRRPRGRRPRLPQTLVNVPGVDKRRADDRRAAARRRALAEAGLGDTGRVLLRSSGTEDLVRVMVEAGTQSEADRVARELADVVLQRLAL